MGFHWFRTPPFSSEEELDGDDVIQACASPDLLPALSSKSNRCTFAKNTVRSDTDWTEGSEVEDSDVSPKPAGELWSLKILLEILFGNSGSPGRGGGTRHWEERLRKCSRKRGLTQKPRLPKEDAQGLAAN